MNAYLLHWSEVDVDLEQGVETKHALGDEVMILYMFSLTCCVETRSKEGALTQVK